MRKRATKAKNIDRYKFAVLAADVALFSHREGELVVRLIRVNRPPYFVDVPGLPGGLLKTDETAEETARRLVDEKALVKNSKVYLEQLYTFSRVDRDKRGRVVAVAYTGLVPWESLTTAEQRDTKDVYWQPAHKVHSLAYDHDEMLAKAISRLRTRISYTTLISKLMPAEFTLTELEEAYEEILGRLIDKRNFRKKMKKLKVVVQMGTKRAGLRHRPAALYKFSSPKVKEIEII